MDKQKYICSFKILLNNFQLVRSLKKNFFFFGKFAKIFSISFALSVRLCFYALLSPKISQEIYLNVLLQKKAFLPKKKKINKKDTK